MASIKEQWESITPEKKRMLTLIALIGVLLFVSSIIVFSTDEGATTKRTKEQIQKDLLTGTDTRALGIDALRGKQKRQTREISDLKKQNLQLQRTIDSMERKFSDEMTKVTRKLAADAEGTKEQLREVEKLLKQTNKEIKTARQVQVSPIPPAQQGKTNQTSSTQQESPETWSFLDLNQYEEPAKPLVNTSRSGGSTGNSQKTGSIRIVRKEKKKEDEQTQPTSRQDDKKIKEFILPATSIITGTLLNGADMPTDQQARQEPLPVLMRIKHHAILPNHFKANVKECFALLAGFGDLSSERAYLRGVKISCVSKDGAVFESKLEAYSTSDDGKTGIRGRVVSKEGAIIARGLLAGFIESIAEIYRPVGIQGIQTTPNANTLFQSPSGGDAIQAGAFGGTSNAAGRLADYYEELADSVFPVIEVEAGRRITIILTDTLKLRTT